MNKVRHSIVDSVVMTVMAQGQPVTHIVPQFGMVLNALHVVCLKPFGTPAALAPVAVPRQDGRLPCQILGASPAATLACMTAPCKTAALGPAVNLRARPFARSAGESPAALCADIGAHVATAGMGTVDGSPYMRGRSLHLHATCGALHAHLLRLVRRAARTRAEALLFVLRPAAIRFLRNRLSASLAWVQGIVRAHRIDLSKPIDEVRA